MTTSDCRRIRDLLAQLVSGEIERGAGREIEAHLLACPACSAEAAGLREALSLLKEEVPPDPGVPYWSSFGGRLRARPPRGSWKQRQLCHVGTLPRRWHRAVTRCPPRLFAAAPAGFGGEPVAVPRPLGVAAQFHRDPM